MAKLQALCMKCRDDNNKPTMQDMKEDSIAVTQKGSRFSAKGQCSSCGGNQFKFLGKDDAMKLKDDGASFTEEPAA